MCTCTLCMYVYVCMYTYTYIYIYILVMTELIFQSVCKITRADWLVSGLRCCDIGLV